ncbi:ORF9 [White spot syndrome virus]|uniref:ORF9 n=1 Tax=White spot syndrome virus TaxID=342409 RepID=A0A2D3I6V9_9VIRU|nr:ORF9 [White spot syndrome virus]
MPSSFSSFSFSWRFRLVKSHHGCWRKFCPLVPTLHFNDVFYTLLGLWVRGGYRNHSWIVPLYI